MTDCPPGTGTAVRPAVPDAPAAPNLAGPATAPEPAACPGCAAGTPMRAEVPPADVPFEALPDEQPVASRQAPAVSATVQAAAAQVRRCRAVRARGAVKRGTCDVMPMGRRFCHGGSHGYVTTWQRAS